MRISALLLLLVNLSQALAQSQEIPIPPILSPAEAEAIVRDQMAESASREKARLESIKSAPSLATWQTGVSTPKTVMRRLAPKQWPARPVPIVGEWTEEQRAEWRTARKRFRTMHLSATVFDRSLSEIQWRKSDLRFTVLSNIDFNYLSMIGWLDSEQTTWSTFFFVSNISSEREERYARMAAARGVVYTPRLIPDRSMLDSGKADYVIYAEPGVELPSELIEDMDALHRHYEANEEALRISWLNRQQLHKARRAWQLANPPAPKDTVINFWPVRSRTNGKN